MLNPPPHMALNRSHGGGRKVSLFRLASRPPLSATRLPWSGCAAHSHSHLDTAARRGGKNMLIATPVLVGVSPAPWRLPAGFRCRCVRPGTRHTGTAGTADCILVFQQRSERCDGGTGDVFGVGGCLVAFGMGPVALSQQQCYLCPPPAHPTLPGCKVPWKRDRPLLTERPAGSRHSRHSEICRPPLIKYPLRA